MTLFKNTGESTYDLLLAENGFIHDIQMTIETAMDSIGMSQSELAVALNVSQSRVSQMLGDNGKNLRARTIARIAHALKCRPCIDFHDGASDWVVADLSDEEQNSDAFAVWVNAASVLLDAVNDRPVDNGWKPAIAVNSTHRMVAA